ncbi:MAG TPA: hypothetical protein VLE23_15770 [Geminicoccaceae bacterium]|nr:hypothetical protein [Geminicoccaceae bacterium]
MPRRLPDLAFWYDAEVSGYAGGTWRDLSGNDNHAAQPSLPRQPAKTTDAAGRDLLRFDGVNDALLVGSPPDLSGGLTFFIVYRMRTPVDFHGIFTASAATGTDHQQFFTLQYEQVANQRIQVFGRSIQPNQVVTQGVDSTEKQYAIATFDDDGVDVELRDLNGIKGDTSTFAPFGTPAAMIIGARYNEGAVFRFGAVDIYEIGLYTRELSPAERDQLEAYVQQRHAMAWNPRFIGDDLAWFHDADASGFALTSGLVDQWNDLTKYGRHWIQSGAGRPLKTTDGEGRAVVRFDGVDDLLGLAGPLPILEPFSVGVVYRIRERSDFAGILSATSPAGTDHSDFWTFRNASAASFEMQLFGRSAASDPLTLSLDDTGTAQIAIWSAGSGTGELRDGGESNTDSFDGSFGAPSAIVLGGRYADAPFGYAAIDVLATIGAARALSTSDQQRLIAWANGKWSL